MKILLTAVLCMLLCVPAFADQSTTVLSQPVSSAKNTGMIPYIDGSNEAVLEKQANGILNDKAQELLKMTGGGTVSYDVKLNRPSMVSVLLKAQGNGKNVYQGVNIDLTTGQEFVLGDFFSETEELKKALGSYTDILFGETGLYLRNGGNGEYTGFVSYAKLLPSMRIGSAGRLVQIAKLTQNAADKVLHIKSGNLMALKLDSNPSTGYRWDVVLDKAAEGKIQKVGSSFIMPREDERTGATGTEILVLAALEAGEYTVNLEYKRPWEQKGFNKFSFKVVVEE